MNAGCTFWVSWTTRESRRAKDSDPWGDAKVEHGANALRVDEGVSVLDVLARRGVTQVGEPCRKRDVIVMRMERLP